MDEYKRLEELLDIILEIYHVAKIKVNQTKELENRISAYDAVFFVDGSCIKSQRAPNKGEVGFGILFKDCKNNKEEEFFGKVTEYNYVILENIGGELWAALEAAKIAAKKGIKKILLCYDYMGIEKYSVGNWHWSDKAVLDYVYQMQCQKKSVEIEFLKIPAHAGIVGNERADALAKQAVGIIKDNNNKNREIFNNKTISEEWHNYYKENYLLIFKILIVLEMIILNSNLNELSIIEQFFNIRVKFNNLDLFLEKNVHLLEIGDIEPLDIEFNDILTE